MIVTEARLACQDPDLRWAYDSAVEGGVRSVADAKVAMAACLEGDGCPILHECLLLGIATKSSGVWGGQLLEPLRYKQRGVCSRNHDITGPNGRVKGDGHRVCRICEAARNAERNRT